MLEREGGGRGGSSASSLSYVILQMEAPSLVEEYFGGVAGSTEASWPCKADEEVDSAQGLMTLVMSRLDALVHPPKLAGRVIWF